MTEDALLESLERRWDELKRYDDELNGTSDRATAILATAYFDGKLGDAIMCRFFQLSSAFSDQKTSGGVFKEHDPIRNFLAKIEVGFALGLYNDEIRKNLHKVGKIRNKFAHSSKPIEFGDDEIANICRQLDPNDVSELETPRRRYIAYLKEVERHLQSSTTNPRAPRELTATAEDTQVNLEWTLPSETLTRMQVRWKKAVDMPFCAVNNWMNLSATATNYKVTDLENGTEYTFEVRAENATGPGEPKARNATPQSALMP